MKPKTLIITGTVDLWEKVVIIVLGLLPLVGGVLMAFVPQPFYTDLWRQSLTGHL